MKETTFVRGLEHYLSDWMTDLWGKEIRLLSVSVIVVMDLAESGCSRFVKISLSLKY
jgi:hypothetical protein